MDQNAVVPKIFSAYRSTHPTTQFFFYITLLGPPLQHMYHWISEFTLIQ